MFGRRDKKDLKQRIKEANNLKDLVIRKLRVNPVHANTLYRDQSGNLKSVNYNKEGKYD